MSVPSGNLNHIVDYLMKKDDDLVGQVPSGLAMDGGLFNDDDWPTNSDELLENFFSMDGGLLDIPNTMVDTMNIPFGEQVSEPARSVAGSDSGLSMDHADLDLLDQQLSPLMMHQSSDDDFLNKSFASSLQQINPSSCGESHSPQSNSSPGQFSPSSSDVEDSPISWPVVEDKTEVSNCQNTPSTDLRQPVQTFQNITNLKRKCSSPLPSAIVLPKVQKSFIQKREPIKNVNIVRSDKQRIILSNHNNATVLNHQPITVQSADVTSTQKKIIRVAPITGNPRKILLPVTIKDMKDLRSIKIINAADLKNQTNIKLAAANFLQKSKQAMENKKKNNLIYAAIEPEEHQYVMEDSTSDRGSCHSDDDDDDRMDDDSHVTRNENGQFPRLELTSEERRLLVKEGISLPSCYPLTRLEERELKRIRRKIRNKISAQDSRRRKKEYVDGLEDRVKQCTEENQSLMRKIKALQSQNQSLASQLKKLQNIVTKGSNYKSAQPATCLMVLLLSVALVMAPSLRAGNGPSQARPSHMPPGYAPHTALLNSIRRALLSAHTSLPSTNHGVNTMEDSVEDVINVDDVSSGQPLNDHNYPLMERQVSNAGGRYTTCGYMDIPIDDENPLGKCYSPVRSFPVKLEKLEYDMEYDGNDLLLSHLEEVDGSDDSKDYKDESIKLYDMAMEKLEVVEGKVGFAHISGKLNELLEYTPQAFKIDSSDFEVGNKKKNITKIRTVMMANMELQ